MRGEKPLVKSLCIADVGSPPLARGKDQVSALSFLPSRITPACAGKSVTRPIRSASWWDHPRLRGEKIDERLYKVGGSGSPPLARGKDLRAQKSRRGGGITPACAGKSYSAYFWSGRRRDHPRLRGEKRKEGRRCTMVEGSPPLARGKVKMCRTFSESTGITPACAGKSALFLVSVIVHQDHPRLRGEKFKTKKYLSPLRGSPPLARGKAFRKSKRKAEFRITPACAGKRSSSKTVFSAYWDHPRLRGEKPGAPAPPCVL